MNRPLNPGEFVTSTLATLIPMSSLQVENSFHMGSRARHAGHHGA